MDKHSENEHTEITQEKICEWMVDHLSKLLNIDAEQVDLNLDFDDYGLDSRDAVGMIGELSEWLGLELDSDLIYEQPTIELLSTFVVKDIEASAR